MSEGRDEFLSEQIRNAPSVAVGEVSPTPVAPSSAPHPAFMLRLRKYLLEPGGPNVQLRPQWLANKLNFDERDL